ncbi:MAG: SUMF1/EgtB/PvdO family nonheme iron enzyme [Candidatus Obscuribacterales bacterium]|nr:SUMF1/EgtB/PvdO family nonheme iron enzyme [Steroidobacteraceae bacterium]
MNSSTSAGNATEYLRRSVGLGVLVVIGIFVTIWLYFQGQQVQMLTAHTLPPAKNLADASRFRADTWYLPTDSLLGFIEVPAGPFIMGSDPEVDSSAFENERWSTSSKQGEVNLPLFYIGRYEVTVAQFRAFVEATNYKADALALSGLADHPITNVAWTDALAYSRWLESMLKESSTTPPQLRQLLNDNWRIGIPSEAEWEKAARSADGRIYPWGNTAKRERANFSGTSTATVGSFTCSECAFALADMSGNVWELTRSPYQSYPYDENDDRANIEADALYVMRGGSFNDPETNVRAAARGGVDPGARRPFIGFRLVLSRF